MPALKIFPRTQAGRVVKRFGGIAALRQAIIEAGGPTLNRITIYRWIQPRKPRDGSPNPGLIPPKNWKWILAAAALKAIPREELVVTDDLQDAAPADSEEVDVFS